MKLQKKGLHHKTLTAAIKKPPSAGECTETYSNYYYVVQSVKPLPRVINPSLDVVRMRE